MNGTLFSQIQGLFERTYVQVGINLEDCLIDRQRCGQRVDVVLTRGADRRHTHSPFGDGQGSVACKHSGRIGQELW